MTISSIALASRAVDRPIGLRTRNDLQKNPSVGGGVIVSDLIASTHHELTREEAWLLDALQNLSEPTPTWHELQKQYEQAFAPRRIRFEELASHLGRLHEAGLLVAERSGQGEALWRRRIKQASNQRRWAWAQLLSIRLPGWNPKPLLDGMRFIGQLFFSPFGAILAFGLWTIAILILMSSASRFANELPHLSDFTSPTWIVSLFIGIAILKTLHELGHALACHRYGAEVREMGVLLLMFMPCLYSDVTDVWRLPSRWQRLIITLAGVLVELSLAAIGVIIWRYSEPGWVHLFALQIVLIASVTTLLVNLNPLMRYDGYYLLSDLTATPNLWTRSRQAMTQLATRWLVKQADPQQRHEPLGIALYGLLSQLFLYSILVGFAWITIAVSRASKAEVVGWALVAIVGLGVVIPSLTKLISWFFRPRRENPLRILRTALVIAGIASLGHIALQISLPERIGAPAIVVPAQASIIAATLGGRLVQSIPLGTKVKTGDLIAKLESPELARRQADIESELAACQLELELIESQRTTDPMTAALIPTAKARIESCQKRLHELHAEIEQLTLRAPRPGIVLPPPRRTPDEGDQLLAWSGRLLSNSDHNANWGAWVEGGDVVAMVANPEAWELELIVADSDAEHLVTGLPVRLAIRQQNEGILLGKVVEIARQSMPQQQEKATSSIFASQWIPQSSETVRKVRVQLETQQPSYNPSRLIAGGLGVARIDVGWKPMGKQLMDWLYATFRLPL